MRNSVIKIIIIITLCFTVHNMKIMIDKVNHGLIDSTDLDEYLEEEYNDNY